MTYKIALSDLLNTKKHPIWDKEVPIVQTGNVYNCYISSEINEPELYNELCHVIEEAEADTIVRLHINTPGGVIDSAFKIIASIKRADAKVVARLSGTVASAGTIISMACSDVEVEDFTSFMIHNYSTGTSGKGHEILDYVNFTDKSLKDIFTSLYSGFLTPKEIKDVISGKDFWMTAEDVRKRWAKKQERINE